MDSKSKISKILDLYTRWGSSDYIGESITQIEHALQCARLASQDLRLEPYDGFIKNCIIVAALLHDIGHLVGLEDGDMEMRPSIDGNDGNGFEGEGGNVSGSVGGASLGIVGHEGVGAAFLRDLGMPSMVCDLVAGHVPAKRYLCTVRPGYYDALSDASKETMRMQGGKMSNAELREFQSGIMPELKVMLREYDDGGKKNNMHLVSGGASMQDYKTHLEMAFMHRRIFD
jgi:predicted HD phosphohydrolase